ncbi:hypothetical protein M413DRAFT_12387 [Hebeloma cylindrosporum]|uniref:Uncharacterized protein n=1 Tax=Hebeloma cylindrosporum TaxID=76867 RepID=A0A0C2YDF5_HEBCY|nr:hypothetical protein M413DRAFT_12387 [Hebeloma cylindrosporum h7]
MFPRSTIVLRNITEEEKTQWEGKLRSNRKPKRTTTGHKKHLDDLWDSDHVFQRGDGVWVKTTEGNWLQGRVMHNKVRVGTTRLEQQGYYYEVRFGNRMNLRRWFAPRNGEIKPDSKSLQRLAAHGQGPPI